MRHLCRGYVGIHSSGFRDFLLKPELLRAIVDSGFEHPSEGQWFFSFEGYLHALHNDFRGVTVFLVVNFKYILQFNMSVFLKQYWEWMLSAKQSQEWGKLQYLCYQHFNRLNLLVVKSPRLCFVILVNWHTR